MGCIVVEREGTLLVLAVPKTITHADMSVWVCYTRLAYRDLFMNALLRVACMHGGVFVCAHAYGLTGLVCLQPHVQMLACFVSL